MCTQGETSLVSYLHSFNVAPGWLLADLLLHVVVCLSLLHTHTGGLVATVVACRVSLVDLRTLLIIKGN